MVTHVACHRCDRLSLSLRVLQIVLVFLINRRVVHLPAETSAVGSNQSPVSVPLPWSSTILSLALRYEGHRVRIQGVTDFDILASDGLCRSSVSQSCHVAGVLLQAAHKLNR